MADRDPRDDPRLAAWATFVRAHARVTRCLERRLQESHGLALADYELLAELARSEARQLRMSELAERLVLSRSGATRLVDRLQAEGLVERVSCETDRRGQHARLTHAGVRRLRAASPEHLHGVCEQFLDRIPAGGHARLEALLSRVVEERA